MNSHSTHNYRKYSHFRRQEHKQYGLVEELDDLKVPVFSMVKQILYRKTRNNSRKGSVSREKVKEDEFVSRVGRILGRKKASLTE